MSKWVTVSGLRDRFHRVAWDNAKAAAETNAAPPGKGSAIISRDEETKLNVLNQHIAKTLRAGFVAGRKPQRLHASAVAVVADRRGDPLWALMQRGNRFASMREIDEGLAHDPEAAAIAHASLLELRAQLTRFERDPTPETFAALPRIERMRLLFDRFHHAPYPTLEREPRLAREVTSTPVDAANLAPALRDRADSIGYPRSWSGTWERLSRQGRDLAYTFTIRKTDGSWRTTQVYDLQLELIDSVG